MTAYLQWVAGYVACGLFGLWVGWQGGKAQGRDDERRRARHAKDVGDRILQMLPTELPPNLCDDVSRGRGCRCCGKNRPDNSDRCPNCGDDPDGYIQGAR